MAVTPKQSLPVPDGGSAPATPAAIAAFGDAVEKQIVQRYATTTARDTAYPSGQRIPGMVTYVDTEGVHRKATGASSGWDLLALFRAVVIDGTVTGTHTGQPLTLWVGSKAVTTDANGDGVILSGPAWGSGGILWGAAIGADIFPIICSTRILSGNLVGRFYNGSTLAASTAIATRYLAIGWT